MYRFFTTLFLCFSVLAAAAQNSIVRTDGVKLDVKVVEVKGSEIHFTKNAENNGKLYVISKEDVVSITYQDGSVQQFPPVSAPIVPKPSVVYNKGRNIIGFRPIDFAFTNLSLLYEHLSANQKVGIRLPISIGISHKEIKGDVYNNFSMLRNRTFSTGLDLNFYVGKPDRFRYYIGPSFQLGFFRYITDYYYPSPGTSLPTSIGTQYAFLLNNGIWYQLDKTILLGMDFGLGFQRRTMSRRYYSDPPTSAKVSGNISIGFQF
ncbi:hypothetical protein Q0590_06560 [Rhodocytophaga aerolata]|uniref:Outer membrane protein beta-barrel domain-containing protein n=1 Tax=Rhodocytophaga aerolata TaxID=455078 RepID=A0ABT8R1E4_9BACT|nr:hypothetical protein [Rhodocytophaga aerolata]MDO1445905.1 hypothetical protein [Rhodocytophaga aerolata]